MRCCLGDGQPGADIPAFILTVEGCWARGSRMLSLGLTPPFVLDDFQNIAPAPDWSTRRLAHG